MKRFCVVVTFRPFCAVSVSHTYDLFIHNESPQCQVGEPFLFPILSEGYNTRSKTLLPPLPVYGKIKQLNPASRYDVFLHERLIEDAIMALDPYASHTLVEQVVDAALQSQSQLDWVIQACRKQAEYIMDRGKAELYSQQPIGSRKPARLITCWGMNRSGKHTWMSY